MRKNRIISAQEVRDLMNRDGSQSNFWGVEEWVAFHNVRFTEEQLHAAAKFPWSRDALVARCEFVPGENVYRTHFAFLGLDYIKEDPSGTCPWTRERLTLSRWRWENKKEIQLATVEDIWGSWRPFEITTCAFRWYLMPLAFIPGSNNKTFEEQTAILPRGYEVPTMIELATAFILYYTKNGIRLNSSGKGLKLGRVRDNTEAENFVVGFKGNDLLTECWLSDHKTDAVYLAASRKLPR